MCSFLLRPAHFWWYRNNVGGSQSYAKLPRYVIGWGARVWIGLWLIDVEWVMDVLVLARSFVPEIWLRLPFRQRAKMPTESKALTTHHHAPSASVKCWAIFFETLFQEGMLRICRVQTKMEWMQAGFWKGSLFPAASSSSWRKSWKSWRSMLKICLVST